MSFINSPVIVYTMYNGNMHARVICDKDILGKIMRKEDLLIKTVDFHLEIADSKDAMGNLIWEKFHFDLGGLDSSRRKYVFVLKFLENLVDEANKGCQIKLPKVIYENNYLRLVQIKSKICNIKTNDEVALEVNKGPDYMGDPVWAKLDLDRANEYTLMYLMMHYLQLVDGTK